MGKQRCLNLLIVMKISIKIIPFHTLKVRRHTYIKYYSNSIFFGTLYHLYPIILAEPISFQHKMKLIFVFALTAYFFVGSGGNPNPLRIMDEVEITDRARCKYNSDCSNGGVCVNFRCKECVGKDVVCDDAF